MDPYYISIQKSIGEWCFFLITILATFNCLKRPDWNFAFGLLSYFMLKCMGEDNVKLMLIILNIGLIVFDLAWVFTLGSVWHGKPTHDKIIWEGFSALHTFILTVSVVIIIIRIIATICMFFLPRKSTVQK